MKKIISILIIFSFLVTNETGGFSVFAQSIPLPVPGTMVNLSPAFEPVLIKGLKVHPENPFLFDFIIDTGNSQLTAGDPQLKEESNKLIKYFLAAMTVPEKDLWVNLSPYEKNRMIATNLGQTEMGRDMLAEDYILKQLTASLIYPEKHLGKTFWENVYARARLLYGTNQIPVNTFNKVWIVADKADVYEHGQTAYVVGAHLKVMLEEDYLSLQKHSVTLSLAPHNDTHSIGANIIRQIILPAIEKEVNEGKNFAPLRQMFYSMILASWYKMALKNAILTQIYGNKSKVKVGINQDDPKANEKIFARYLRAYKKGVFNYIKEDIGQSGATVSRKYFSGGLQIGVSKVLEDYKNLAMLPAGDGLKGRSFVDETITVNPAQALIPKGNEAMVIYPHNSGFILLYIFNYMWDLPGGAVVDKQTIIKAVEAAQEVELTDALRKWMNSSGFEKDLREVVEGMADWRPTGTLQWKKTSKIGDTQRATNGFISQFGWFLKDFPTGRSFYFSFQSDSEPPVGFSNGEMKYKISIGAGGLRSTTEAEPPQEIGSVDITFEEGKLAQSKFDFNNQWQLLQSNLNINGFTERIIERIDALKGFSFINEAMTTREINERVHELIRNVYGAYQSDNAGLPFVLRDLPMNVGSDKDITNFYPPVVVSLLTLMESLLDLPDTPENKGLIDQILEEVNNKILPSMRQHNIKLSQVFPKAQYWLVFTLLPRYGLFENDKKMQDLLIVRVRSLISYLASRSNFQGLAFLLTMIGMHLRHDRIISADYPDLHSLDMLLEALVPMMRDKIKQHKAGQEVEDLSIYSQAIISGLNVPYEDYATEIDKVFNRIPGLEDIARYIFQHEKEFGVESSRHNLVGSISIMGAQDINIILAFKKVLDIWKDFVAGSLEAKNLFDSKGKIEERDVENFLTLKNLVLADKANGAMTTPAAQSSDVTRSHEAVYAYIKGIRNIISQIKNSYAPAFQSKHIETDGQDKDQLLGEFDASEQNNQVWLACYYGISLAEKYMVEIENYLSNGDIGVADANASHLESTLAKVWSLWANASRGAVFPEGILVKDNAHQEDSQFFAKIDEIFKSAFYKAKNLQSEIGGDVTERKVSSSNAARNDIKSGNIPVEINKGLHIEPSMMIFDIALLHSDLDITLEYNGQKVNPRAGVNGIVALEITKGSTMYVEIKGGIEKERDETFKDLENLLSGRALPSTVEQKPSGNRAMTETGSHVLKINGAPVYVYVGARQKIHIRFYDGPEVVLFVSKLGDISIDPSFSGWSIQDNYLRYGNEDRCFLSAIYGPPTSGLNRYDIYNRYSQDADLNVTETNAAMATPGGIDLSRAQINVSKQGNGVRMRFDPAMIARIKKQGFDGLEFHIQSIVPVTNLPVLLGLNSDKIEGNT